MRRHLGYIVKLPDGTRSSLLAGPASLLTARKVVAEQAPVGAYLVPVFAVRKPKPRPRVRLGEWAGSPEAAASVTGPAPVVSAAETRAARASEDLRVMRSTLTAAQDDACFQKRKREEAEAKVVAAEGSWGYQLGDGFVGGFPTEAAAQRHFGYRCSERAGRVVFAPSASKGEHDAAVAAAYADGATALEELELEHEAAEAEPVVAALREVRSTLVQCCVDFAEDEAHAGGLAHAVLCLDGLIAEKKGQAK